MNDFLETANVSNFSDVTITYKSGNTRTGPSARMFFDAQGRPMLVMLRTQANDQEFALTIMVDQIAEIRHA